MNGARRLHLVAAIALAIVMWAAAPAVADSTGEQQAAIEAMYDRDWTLAEQGVDQPLAAKGAVTQAQGMEIYLGQIYASKPGSGAIIGCNIALVTDTPAPTRGMRFGSQAQCNDPSISGTGISHLGEFYPSALTALKAGSFYAVGGDNVWRGAEHLYTRRTEDQLEQIYAFFSFDISIPGAKWTTTPTVGGAAYDIQCAGLNTSRITCAVVTLPFPFLPTSADCATGGICEVGCTARSAARNTLAPVADLDNQAALLQDQLDAQVDAVVGIGDPDEQGPDEQLPELPTIEDRTTDRALRATACAAGVIVNPLIGVPAEVAYCTSGVIRESLIPIVGPVRAAQRARACFKADRARREVTREQRRRFTTKAANRYGGIADAFRHCAWSGRMTQTMGTKWATKFGDLHERKTPNPQPEKNMDLHNNEIGRGYGRFTENMSDRARKLWDYCETAARDGGLVTLPTE